MENEIWKEIEGYNGDYLISDFGRIKSLKYNKQIYLKPIKSGNGYYYVNLTKNKIQKKLYIHRLVGKSFIPNPENKPEINHINGIKTDNSLKNLEFCTAKQNIQHGWQTGLMKNTRKACKKNIIIAQESRKMPIYSKKLNMRFESCSDAANYLKTHYFENTTFGCLQKGINRLLLNQRIKSKYDFCWEYVITNQ